MYSHGRGSDVSCDIEIRDPKVLHTQKVPLKQENIIGSHLLIKHHQQIFLDLYLLNLIDCHVGDLFFGSSVTSLTSICLLLKTLLMLELKAAPENMEVTGYVKSKTFLNTEVISCKGSQRKERSNNIGVM